ncbi:MAG: 2Fe-2S iron-sulfur cluster-binding protein [Anaerolineae bacterium]|nr:2Fe-2S iron-sulfur cluster-binding protein [Anaerolineae bacterium]MDQ7035308.1 2Fe-2S iron-sulfur cluster-binding protein [Anaerolineae bacterium]
MPSITIKDGATFEATADKRLVLAIEDSGVDILHRCGGYAGCTTCRVVVHEGEPTTMTKAELEKLQENEAVGQYRLSCQILCDHDMTVEPLMRVSSSNYDDAGKRPKDTITPDAEWVDKPTS